MKLFCLKVGLPKLEKIEIKYGFAGFEIKNNIVYWNFSRFEIEFELKTWDFYVLNSIEI
jgi:hypothetical protein